MKSAIVLIDGGFLRSQANKTHLQYIPSWIETFAHACLQPDEECLRVLYYDCAPYVGRVTLPVSGTIKEFNGSDRWLHDIAMLDLFAVRRGVLKFRGFERRRGHIDGALTDDDLDPHLNRKAST